MKVQMRDPNDRLRRGTYQVRRNNIESIKELRISIAETLLIQPAAASRMRLAAAR